MNSPETSSFKYQKSRQTILIIAATFTMLGITTDYFTYIHNYPIASQINAAITMLISSSVLIFYFFDKSRFKLLFIILSYAVVLNIAMDHIFHHEYLGRNTYPETIIFTRDMLFIICYITMGGYIGIKFHILIQTLILLILILFYGFILNKGFFIDNLFLFLVTVISFGILTYFSAKKTTQYREDLHVSFDFIQNQKKELEIKNNDILDSIRYAKRIQAAILPPNRVVKSYLPDSFILYLPKDIVAGDFYWMENKNDTILFAAADCTGHGVPGALVSVVCHNSLNRAVNEFNLLDPGEILNKTKEMVIHEFEKSDEDVNDGMDIALCTLKGNELSYAGAFNPLWIIKANSNEIIEISPDRQPIGQFMHENPYTTHKLTLDKGDTLYLFTDGYVDQFGGERSKKFKPANLRKLLLKVQEQPLMKQRLIINQTFEDWKGDLEQVDDVCMIGVRIS